MTPAQSHLLLPPSLADRSLSRSEIILPLDDAVRAVEHLARGGRTVVRWEGWVRLPDGGRTRSLAHPGPFALPMDADAAATEATEAMRKTQAHWDRSPEYPGGTLYFRIELAAG